MNTSNQFGISIVDAIIFFVLITYAFEGIRVGFQVALLDLISFVLSFIFGLKFYGFIAQLLLAFFSLPNGFANALGFFIGAFLSEIIISFMLRIFVNRAVFRFYPFDGVSLKYKKGVYILGKVSGLVFGMTTGLILLSFIFSVIVALPFSPLLKQSVMSSALGKILVAYTHSTEKSLNDVFGQAFSETLNFLTVKPQSNEFVMLHFKTTQVAIDEEAEILMLRLVNSERIKRGIKPVIFDATLQKLAREHSRDMLERGYFSHYTPDGKSPFDRMEEMGIQYMIAGENLALAPSTELAMQGLMNSKGHKENILSPNFGKLGLGVIDGGIYGKMYSQEFTN